MVPLHERANRSTSERTASVLYAVQSAAALASNPPVSTARPTPRCDLSNTVRVAQANAATSASRISVSAVRRAGCALPASPAGVAGRRLSVSRSGPDACDRPEEAELEQGCAEAKAEHQRQVAP